MRCRRPRPGRLLPLLLALLILLAAACREEAGRGGSPEPQATATAAEEATTAVPADLTATIQAIKERTAALRELEPRGATEDRLLTREQAAEKLARELEEDRELGDPALEDVYQLLDFIGPGESLRDLMLRLLQSQVAGFYIPEEDTLYVLQLGGDFDVLEEVTLAHEYVHALQDQHFDLDGLDRRVEGDWDADLALSALVEGDATVAEFDYLFLHAAAGALRGMEEDAARAAAELRSFPPPLVRELQFPYDAGGEFVRRWYRSGGWEAVDALYARPPQTTEQVLHPEKYEAGEGPAPVTPPDLAGVLGSGWRRTGEGTLGEFTLRNHLLTQLSSAEARSAAAGWGGGRWALYQGPDGARVLLAALAWDTPEEAAEFMDAYARWLAARSGGEARPAPAGVRWAGGDRAAAALRAAGRTFLVVADRPPDLDRVLAVLGGA